MNENDNLYDMVEHPEEKFGRMGDTLIRQVDGQDAHVNAWEASIVDSYGKSGEKVVKKVEIKNEPTRRTRAKQPRKQS